MTQDTATKVFVARAPYVAAVATARPDLLERGNGRPIGRAVATANRHRDVRGSPGGGARTEKRSPLLLVERTGGYQLTTSR